MPLQSLFAAYKNNITLNNAFLPSGAGVFLLGKGSFDTLLISLSQAGMDDRCLTPLPYVVQMETDVMSPLTELVQWPPWIIDLPRVIAVLFLFINCSLCCSPEMGHSSRLAKAGAEREVVPHLPVTPSSYLLGTLCFLTLTAAVRQWTSLPAKTWWDSASAAATAAWIACDHGCLVWQRGRILALLLTLCHCFPDIGPQSQLHLPGQSHHTEKDLL